MKINKKPAKQRLLALLLCASMVLSMINGKFYNTQAAIESSGAGVEDNDDENLFNVNPKYTIQHYFLFPKVVMNDDVKSETNPDGVDTTGLTKLEILNTSKVANKNKDESWVSDALSNVANRSAIKDFVFLDRSGKVKTELKLEKLFEDEDNVEFEKKPRMIYMNRLYNSSAENHFNPNYTLSEVWVQQPDLTKKDGGECNPQSTDRDDFIVYVAPTQMVDGIQRHDPSGFIFTNNPKNKGLPENKIPAEPIPTPGDEVEPTNGSHTICIKEGTIIRLVFTTTDGEYEKKDVDFFDYDISDGKVYSNANFTQEGDRNSAGELYAKTKGEGINNPNNVSGDGKQYAFGNQNTGTDLGKLKRTDITDGSDKGKEDYFNAYNYSASGVKGASFGLVTGMNLEEKTLQWATDIKAPAIFDRERHSTSDNPIYGKTNYVNDEFSLIFDRDGGTYTLEKVNKGSNTVVDNLDTFVDSFSLFKAQNGQPGSGGPWTNSFWPMDYADSHGTNGHDMKFGAGTAKYTTDADGNVKLSRTANDKRKYSSGTFPISDDAKDHNSYFGMSFYTDFVVDPGYIAPLRYFFYGDDDLWVFLSETEIDENGNVTGLKNAKLIADIGGVHSSIGEYVNLWDYIEYIPYTKDGKPDGLPNESKHYRLTFFYTERGASGSSCYMRFSLPFASLVTQPPGYNEMKIEKQVKKSSDSTIDGLNEDDEFAFILHLYNGPIGKEDTKELENGYSYTRYEIINGVPKEVTKTLPYITTGSEFRLKDNEYIEIKKLPAETYYRVEELPKIIDAETGKEKEDKYDFTTLYIGSTEDEDMASSVMREGRATEGTVKEQNWVRFENALNPGILTLEKKLTSGDAPTSETFSFAVTLKDPEGNPIKNLSWLQYKRDNGETKDDSMVKQQDKTSETGEYTFDLAAGEKVMFYDLPKGTQYTITETSRQDYPLYGVTVNEKDVDFTETETGRTINGTINETKIEESQESIFRADVIFTNTQKNSIVELKKEQSLSGQITDDPKGRTTERLTVTEGDTVTYYLTVTNTGENNATDVKVYDEIPFTDPLRLELLDTVTGWHNTDDGKAGTQIAGSGGREEDGYKLTWEVGTLEPGKSATLVFQVKIPGVKAYTEWDNEASAVYKGNNPDDLEEPKEIASEKVWIEEQVPDLRWEKKQTVQSEGEPSKPEEPTDATLSVDAGDTVTYYITVTNDGEADAKNVQISDTIPTDQAKKNQLVFVPGSIEVDEVSVADKDAWDEETQIVKWTLDIPSHTSRTLTFQVKVPQIGESTAWKNIAAILTPDEPDKPKPTDPVYVVPHLDIMKQQAVNGGTRTKDPLDVKPGDQVTYYITVENNSEGNAKAVTVTDEIPSDGNIYLGPVKEDSIKGVVNETGKVITGSQRGNTIYWDAFDLKAGQSAVVEFTVGVPESGHKWTNIGYVSYTPDITPDPDDPTPQDPKPTDPEPTNPVDIKKDETEEAPKLSWKKQQTVRREGEPERPEIPTTSTLSVEEGEIVTYYITVTNEGDMDAKGVGITDTILTDLDAADGKENPLIFIEGSVKVDGNSVKDENVWNSETKTIKWTGDVPARASKVLSFQVRVPEIKESTAWKNVAAIFTPDEPDKPKPTDPVYVVPHLDIRKEQSVNGGERTTRLLEVKPEDQVTYYITVENNSEGSAKAVTVTDEIPSDGNIYLGPVKEGSIKGVINGTGKEITGSQKGNTIYWDAFDLDAGQSAVLEFTVGVPESGHEWTNIGYVSYTPDITPDPDDPNAPDPKPTDPEPTNPVDIRKEETEEPKLTIRKTQYIGDDDSKETEGLLSVKPGDVITYCITVSNDSDVKADNVIVTDPIPEGLSFVDGSARPDGTVKDGVITWKIGTLEAHSSVSVQFQAKVPEVKETTKWTNIAYVTEGDPDPDPEEPGTPSNEVEAVPGIRIEKTQKLTKDVDGRPTTDLLHVKSGDQVTYYLTVTNTGDARAYDVVVKDTLPTDGAGNDLTLVKGGEDSSYDEASREITWNLGDLEAGASRTVEFTVTVPEGGSNWINGAFASFIPPDPEDSEKPGPEKDRTPDIPSNEVEIEKTEDKAPAIQIRKTQKAVRDTESQPTTSLLHVKKGDQVTYYLTVANTGDAPAYDVIVKDLIPTDEAGNQLTLVEGSVRGGESSNYDETRGEITWSLGNLGEGEQRTVEFTVTVPSEGTHWRNIATTSYVPKNPDDPKDPEDPEPERTPDIPSNEVEIDKSEANIVVRKLQSLNGGEATRNTLNVKPGDVITYRLAVSNESESSTDEVIVTDPVPEGLILDESSIVPQGTVETGQDGRQTITWQLGALEAGEEKNLEFKVTVPQTDKAARWTNIAYVTNDPDPDPDNPGTPSNEVEAVPGIEIEKTQQVNGQGEPTKETLHVQKGDEVTYYLTVVNTGDAKALDVIVTDEIPEDGAGNCLELIEGSVEGGESNTVSGRVITWNLGDLEAGESRTLKFTVRVPSDGSRWKNIAVTSYIPENPSPENPNPENPDPEDPEPERTPDIPSNEVEIEAGTTKIQLRARKVLNGAVLTNGQFTFRIQGISAEITEETESETQKADAAGKPGEDTETPETGGSAQATPSNAERGESETREPGGLSRSGRRTVTEKVLTQARTLEVLVKGDGMRSGSGTVPMPSADTATNNEDGEIVFGEMEYSLPGIYTYKITEVRENRRGYTFDTTEYTVEVVVTRDDSTGELRAEARIAKPEGADEILFTNRYRRSGGGGGNPGGGGGSDPQPGPGTDPTPDPTPENPDTPAPENPQPVPDTPVLPDPNDPNSPPTVTIEENGVPRTYVKVWDPVNEEFIYIPEEDVPLFGLLPKTGDEERQRWLRVILALSLAGIGTLTVGERRKRRRRTGDQTES